MTPGEEVYREARTLAASMGGETEPWPLWTDLPPDERVRWETVSDEKNRKRVIE